jgi:phosphohistidine phosphatase
MRVYLVHHGEAVSPDEDVQRPLTTRGLEAARQLAAESHHRGVRPDAIWHSGKLRARQTAEAFWRACNPFAEFSAHRGLQPADPPDWMRDRLLGETRDVMCVGHLPHLARLLALLSGRPDSEATWPVHGVVALEADAVAEARWRELWRLTPGDAP